MSSIEPRNPILIKMLDRLFAAMLNGPSINCRPHASRQRIDLNELLKFQDLPPAEVLARLLSSDATIKLTAQVSRPAKTAGDDLSPEQSAAMLAWENQQAVRSKLRIIADDARTYEQDTGVAALHLGFPLLSLPPGMFAAKAGGISSRRVLAPIAFIPLSLVVKNGPHAAIELARRDGAEGMIPNDALLTWLERESGKPLGGLASVGQDLDLWNEIALLTRTLADAIGVPIPHPWGDGKCPIDFNLRAVAREDTDPRAWILPSAVLGLYPASNQGLVRDTREMIAAGASDGPLASFIHHGISLEQQPIESTQSRSDAEAAIPKGSIQCASEARPRNFAAEKWVAAADPCQAAAIRLAAEQRGLVVHGPPGTGKSQTITNIISDHLGRGERVLFVCDKRTALDVVSDRLTALGLGGLCAIVHDPRRDQRDLYHSVSEQLDGLVDAPVNPRAIEELARLDDELQTLHADLLTHHRSLIAPQGGPGSFHHLVGAWLAETGGEGATLDEAALAALSGDDLLKHDTLLKEIFQRGDDAGWMGNAWREAAGIEIADFLAAPMERYRSALAACVAAAAGADATCDPQRPDYVAQLSIVAQADEHARLAQQLRDVLDRISPADRDRWMNRPIDTVRDARDRLALVRDWADALRVEPAEEDAASAREPRVKLAGDISADELARDREILNRYLKSFATLAADFLRVRRTAGAEADDATILRWITSGAQNAAAALRRLDAARPLVAAVEHSFVDPLLRAPLDRLRASATQISEWLAALDAYLDIAGKPLGLLQFSRKRAAAAVTQVFNFALTVETARQLREFLLNYLARLDLHDALEAATGEQFPARPDEDDALIAAFHRNFVVVSAVATTPDKTLAVKTTDTSVPLTDEQTEAIHRRIAPAAAAAQLLAGFDLDLAPSDARQLEMILRRLEARQRLAEVFTQIVAEPGRSVPESDEALIQSVETHTSLLDLAIVAHDRKTYPPLADAIRRAIADTSADGEIIAAMASSPHRAAAIMRLEESLSATSLFDPLWLVKLRADLLGGREALPTLQPLADKLPQLEGVLRVRDALAKLPAPLAVAAKTLLEFGASAMEGCSAIRRAVLSCEISRRLRAEPDLQNIDGHRLKNTFDRFDELSRRKQLLVRETILGHWTQRQKNRLLAQTGTRLNSLGGDLRRRITARGNKALRLRQVLSHGASIPGGDPLLELRPVWMASPETVAQLFPREALFDLVVFDEASQCKLEEALPVLTRAGRVVIAGDPQQLPPARFFESSIATTDQDDADTERALFESQQGEIEDLLAAALGLDVQQSYLDVHYRSKSADLIAFSNEQFYNARLQPLPASPAAQPKISPITLHAIEGVYEKRRNDAEAERVVEIVRDLLSRENPPSIGIACFNLPQRDWIAEKLEEAAEEDDEFAEKLADARSRQGANSAEGLFVKNLENVQGDERDHLIISTTYGPDRAGRFRRNFGPVGRPGGGRRLNVLVTRAREHVHVVTSIPRSAYATLAPIPQGHRPGGAWLLFAYLNYCEALERRYAENATSHADEEKSAARVNVLPSRAPSVFAESLANRAADANIAFADVHFGSAGFCIDVALRHPDRPQAPALAVLCDTTRYAVEDPVEWEAFRTSMLASQGWAIHRVWTPHFFRDPSGSIAEIERSLAAAVEQQAAQVRTDSAEAEGFGVRRVVSRRRKLKSAGKNAA